LRVCRWILLWTRGFQAAAKCTGHEYLQAGYQIMHRAAQERARFDRMIGWLCLKGGILWEYDRLVARLKPDLLTTGGLGGDARSLPRDESLSRSQCRTINLHSSVLNASSLNVFLLLSSQTLVSLQPTHFVTALVKLEQPDSGDKRCPLLRGRATPGVQKTSTTSRIWTHRLRIDWTRSWAEMRRRTRS
jgi:hypothetical protein